MEKVKSMPSFKTLKNFSTIVLGNLVHCLISNLIDALQGFNGM